MGVINEVLQVMSQAVTLKDGTQLTVRGILPEDTPRLQAFHQRLLPESIYRRYLEFHKILTGPEADHLCRVDYHQRMAFVATYEVDGEQRIAGVARYDLIESSHPRTAEVAVIIDDAFQRRGLGSLLFGRLVTYARLESIQAFVAAFFFENTGFLNLVRRSGLPMALKTVDAGVYEARILLNAFSLN